MKLIKLTSVSLKRLNMKVVIVFIICTVTVWAFPKTENEPVLPKPYITKISEKFPGDLVPRIINGGEAVPHSIPYQAHLVILSTGIGGWTCSGSLITPKHVLTSAHCIVDGAGAYVHLGAHDIEKSETTKVVVESRTLIPHADYNAEKISNDIGIIVLKESVDLNDYVNVAVLPSRNINNSYQGEIARISGWGLTSGEGNRTSVLLEANVTVISNEQCREVYTNVLDSQLCALGRDGEGICDGDTGGPLVVNNIQIGIISYGPRGCRSDYPSAYTRISSYLNWIEEVTGLGF